MRSRSAQRIRRAFRISWPQCVIMLAVAGVPLASPEVKPVQYALSGVLVAVVAVGVFLKLTENRSSGAGEDDSHG